MDDENQNDSLSGDTASGDPSKVHDKHRVTVARLPGVRKCEENSGCPHPYPTECKLFFGSPRPFAKCVRQPHHKTTLCFQAQTPKPKYFPSHSPARSTTTGRSLLRKAPPKTADVCFLLDFVPPCSPLSIVNVPTILLLMGSVVST